MLTHEEVKSVLQSDIGLLTCTLVKRVGMTSSSVSSEF